MPRCYLSFRTALTVLGCALLCFASLARGENVEYGDGQFMYDYGQYFDGQYENWYNNEDAQNPENSTYSGRYVVYDGGVGCSGYGFKMTAFWLDCGENELCKLDDGSMKVYASFSTEYEMPFAYYTVKIKACKWWGMKCKELPEQFEINLCDVINCAPGNHTVINQPVVLYGNDEAHYDYYQYHYGNGNGYYYGQQAGDINQEEAEEYENDYEYDDAYVEDYEGEDGQEYVDDYEDADGQEDDWEGYWEEYWEEEEAMEAGEEGEEGVEKQQQDYDDDDDDVARDVNKWGVRRFHNYFSNKWWWKKQWKRQKEYDAKRNGTQYYNPDGSRAYGSYRGSSSSNYGQGQQQGQRSSFYNYNQYQNLNDQQRSYQKETYQEQMNERKRYYQDNYRNRQGGTNYLKDFAGVGTKISLKFTFTPYTQGVYGDHYGRKYLNKTDCDDLLSDQYYSVIYDTNYLKGVCDEVYEAYYAAYYEAYTVALYQLQQSRQRAYNQAQAQRNSNNYWEDDYYTWKDDYYIVDEEEVQQQQEEDWEEEEEENAVASVSRERWHYDQYGNRVSEGWGCYDEDGDWIRTGYYKNGNWVELDDGEECVSGGTIDEVQLRYEVERNLTKKYMYIFAKNTEQTYNYPNIQCHLPLKVVSADYDVDLWHQSSNYKNNWKNFTQAFQVSIVAALGLTVWGLKRRRLACSADQEGGEEDDGDSARDEENNKTTSFVLAN